MTISIFKSLPLQANKFIHSDIAQEQKKLITLNHVYLKRQVEPKSLNVLIYSWILTNKLLYFI